MPEEPNEVWQVDFRFVYQLLTFLDAFSRLPIHHELLAQATSQAAAMILREAVGKNRGVPAQVIATNNGSAVVNLKGKRLTAFQQICYRMPSRIFLKQGYPSRSPRSHRLPDNCL